MNLHLTLCLLSCFLGITPYSVYASEQWDSLASHINTNVPPSELTQEVNDVLHQTFDQAIHKKK